MSIPSKTALSLPETSVFRSSQNTVSCQNLLYIVKNKETAKPQPK